MFRGNEADILADKMAWFLTDTDTPRPREKTLPKVLGRVSASPTSTRERGLSVRSCSGYAPAVFLSAKGAMSRYVSAMSRIDGPKRSTPWNESAGRRAVLEDVDGPIKVDRDRQPGFRGTVLRHPCWTQKRSPSRREIGPRMDQTECLRPRGVRGANRGKLALGRVRIQASERRERTWS
jgi:hypothetical protein